MTIYTLLRTKKVVPVLLDLGAAFDTVDDIL